ncbi:MAG: LysR family transcriptional regulator [Rhodobacteraceae bacterium]|nr:LysR family transcriptional regulator [Paracoccaceae bacterium]
MSLKLDMMRCFRIVARHGTLAGAAEALGRTASAVSMTLAQFEAHIGAPLFETDRKNRLTPLGLRVLEECNRALDAFDRSSEAIGRHARSTAGIVRVVAVPSAAITLLPEAIGRFSSDRPDVRLEIGDGDSAEVRRRLLYDDADIGIVSAAGDRDEPEDPGLHQVTLRSDRLGIVARADSAVFHARAEGWDALRKGPLVANPLNALVEHAAVRDLTGASTLFALNTTTLLAFVEAGLGATILPQRVMRGIAGNLRFFAPEVPEASRCLAMVTSARRRLPPAAVAFAGILAAVSVDMPDA